MMELRVHLHQPLLHVLDTGGSILGQPVSLAHAGTLRRDLRLGSEAAAQQAVRVELAQLPRIADIGFATGHVLGVTGGHQDYIEASGCEDLKRRDSVDACRFHRHAGDTTVRKAIDQNMHVLGERAEDTHWHVST